MTALNESFSNREVQQMWRVNVALWEREQYEDDDAMLARAETDRLRKADARYPFDLALSDLQRKARDEWDSETGEWT